VGGWVGGYVGRKVGSTVQMGEESTIAFKDRET
jgi:hypothetical protein